MRFHYSKPLPDRINNEVKRKFSIVNFLVFVGMLAIAIGFWYMIIRFGPFTIFSIEKVL